MDRSAGGVLKGKQTKWQVLGVAHTEAVSAVMGGRRGPPCRLPQARLGGGTHTGVSQTPSRVPPCENGPRGAMLREVRD